MAFSRSRLIRWFLWPLPDERPVARRRGHPARRAPARAEALYRPDDGHYRPPPAQVPATRQPPVRQVVNGREPATTRERSVWGTPIIGTAIADFEPRPPVSISYRPDCVADGWETEDFIVRAASVRGYVHRYRGTPRQDDVAIVYHQRTGAVVFAVADGVSAAHHSHIGATAACRAAVNAILADLDGETGQIEWQGVVQRTAWQLIEQARAVLHPEADSEMAERELATTLVAGLVRGTASGPEVSMIQVGDSSAWLLRDGRYRCLLDVKNSPDAEVVSSATTALPRVPRVTPRGGPLASGEVLLVGTDGFGDPLGDGDGAVGDHFAGLLTKPRSLFAFAAGLDFSRETFDDDRTLVAIWVRNGPAKGRR
jgi:protein phosphatase 2C-like protein